MIKFKLNPHKFNNYAFFCPVSRLHLTVSSPVGFSNEVTPAILRALKAKTILDIDGVIDIETGTVKAAKETKTNEVKTVAEAPKSETPAKEVKEESAKEIAEEPKEEDKQDKKVANKRGKRTETAPIDEAKETE
jgi:hypothetical protein